MRNVQKIPLYVAGVIFFLMGCAQLLRYWFKMSITFGEPYPYVIPVDGSLYVGIFALILAIWMFLTARS